MGGRVFDLEYEEGASWCSCEGGGSCADWNI
jgi:hypothetical protein